MNGVSAAPSTASLDLFFVVESPTALLALAFLVVVFFALAPPSASDLSVVAKLNAYSSCIEVPKCCCKGRACVASKGKAVRVLTGAAWVSKRDVASLNIILR